MRDERGDQRCQYLGNGPAATGGGGVWHMSSELFARCIRCGDFVPLNPDEYVNCQRGALYMDRDAGRFGSSLGDNQIEIYRYKP